MLFLFSVFVFLNDLILSGVAKKIMEWWWMEALKATFLLSIDLHFVKSCHSQDQNDKAAVLEKKKLIAHIMKMWKIITGPSLKNSDSQLFFLFVSYVSYVKWMGASTWKEMIYRLSRAPWCLLSMEQKPSPTALFVCDPSSAVEAKCKKKSKSFCDSFLDQREAKVFLGIIP